MIPGVDVSKYQGIIDWATCADSGIAFAWCKATEGLTVVDETFARNWSELGKLGPDRIRRGAYAFFHPESDPGDQAAHFFATVGPLRPRDLRPMLDVETEHGVDPATIVGRVVACMARIESLFGVRPVLYTGSADCDMWRLRLSTVNCSMLSGFDLWVADYRPTPHPPPPWRGQWAVWQYSGSGRAAGIVPPVDRNWMQPDKLDALSVPVPPAVPLDAPAAPLGAADRAEQEARDAAAR